MFKSKEGRVFKKQLNLQEILLWKKDTESLKLKDGKRYVNIYQMKADILM